MTWCAASRIPCKRCTPGSPGTHDRNRQLVAAACRRIDAACEAPTLADLENPETGPQLEEFIAGAGCSARERVQVMKLAWDTVATQFGGRQDIYETFFAGDPELGRQLHYRTPRRAAYQEMVERLLRESDPS